MIPIVLSAVYIFYGEYQKNKKDQKIQKLKDKNAVLKKEILAEAKDVDKEKIRGDQTLQGLKNIRSENRNSLVIR